MAQYIDPPQEPGFYLAATKDFPCFNTVVEVKGEAPFLCICEVHTRCDSEFKGIERFGPRMSLSFPETSELPVFGFGKVTLSQETEPVIAYRTGEPESLGSYSLTKPKEVFSTED